ncbi:hypothetical protein HMPREF0083_01743 [Aneurinibacillus aneurinilyticus ATCC 12856]|uniref:Uncharacterized protein n=1 Tax=Aneurinibacillus aneurinilyticus ATCC 12856 TaxID=649747 RepID=U1WNE5_ANEAE|nr:hypothetical protein HMPREF0083_01743 [Aneurinibacillus aneurinilyticus ATCC 12856]
MVGSRRFVKEKRLDAPCAPAPAHRPSFLLTSHHKNVSIYQI